MIITGNKIILRLQVPGPRFPNLKVKGYTWRFWRNFSQEDNFCDFLFTFLHKKALLKKGLLYKERMKLRPKGANSFFIGQTSF